MELENKWVTANDLIIGQEIKGIHKGRWIRYFSVFVKKVDSECTVCGKKDKLKETESDDLKNLVNFVSGDISEVGELSTANTCESDKNATLYTYHIRYHIKDDKGNRYYVAIEYTKKSKMNTDAGVTYISISLLNDDDTDSSVVSVGKAT